MTDNGFPKLGERYQVVRVIGDGGMGTVYLARHTSVGKSVAVKVLRREAAEHPGARERFLNEAQAAALIAHPNVVECFDVGETDDGLPYLVFEYLEGAELLEELNEVGQMPVRRVLKIARQIASALTAAHSKGVIHRDLKPENIYLTFREDNPDHVKLLDFGISKFSRTRRPSTEGPTMVGTPHYMAPEQYADADAIDGRADVYALGALAYRMLAGCTPFADAPISELAQRVWSETPALLSTHRPDVPKGLADLVSRALRSAISERPTMDALLRELATMTQAGTGTPLPQRAGSIDQDGQDIVRSSPLATPLPTMAPTMGGASASQGAWRHKSSFIALAGGLIIGAAIFAFASHGKPPAMPQAPVIITQEARPAAAMPVQAPALPTVTESKNVGMAIASNAATAKVLIRGQSYDLPLAFELERGGQPELVEVTAAGYEGRRFWLRLDGPTRIVAKLKPGHGTREATENETKIAIGEMADPDPVVAVADVNAQAQAQAHARPTMVASIAPSAPSAPGATSPAPAAVPAVGDVAAAAAPAPTPTPPAMPSVEAPTPTVAAVAPTTPAPAAMPAVTDRALTPGMPAPTTIVAPPTQKPSIDPVLAQRYVDAHAGEVAGCLKTQNVALKTRGTVKLELSVDANGKVTRSSVRSSDVENPAVYACAMKTARAWHLPRPTDGQAASVIVWFPLVTE